MIGITQMCPFMATYQGKGCASLVCTQAVIAVTVIFTAMSRSFDGSRLIFELNTKDLDLFFFFPLFGKI